MLDDFRQGLDEQDAISLHANPTNIDEDSGSNRVSNNGETDTPAQNDRDKGSHNKDADQGSAVGGTPQKDTDSSIGELFRNRKRHSSKDDDEPPLKMSRKILHPVEDDLDIPEVEGLAFDELLAANIGHAYFESSANDAKLQKKNESKSTPNQSYGCKAPKIKA